MDTNRRPMLLAAGRAAAWLAVAMLALALVLSAVAFIDVGNNQPRTGLDVVGLVIAWVALAAFPIALLAAMVGVRLRAQAAPPLLGPVIMLGVGALVLWWVHGAWLLVPAGVLVVSVVMFEARRRLPGRGAPRRAPGGVATDL